MSCWFLMAMEAYSSFMDFLASGDVVGQEHCIRQLEIYRQHLEAQLAKRNEQRHIPAA